jgi:methyl-accepting chemotaxis protein
MTVNQKTWLGFGSLLALVAVGSAIGVFKSYQAEATNTRLVRDYLAEYRATNLASDQIAKMRLHEQRFLSEKVPAEATEVKARVAQLKEHLAATAVASLDPARKEAAAKAAATVDAYLAAFTQLEQLMVRRGLTPELGLEGELRKVVHTVEAKIKGQGLAELDVLVLMARRHEKDYLLRGDPKYFDEIRARVGEFDAQMKQFSLPAALQKDLADLWGKYTAAMKAVIDGDGDIRQKRDEFRRLATSAGQQIDAIAAATAQDMQAVGATTVGTLAAGKKIVSGTGLLSILIGLGLAFVLARGITRPLRRMADTLTAAADQSASATGQISASSQVLAEGASEQAASIEETSASLEEMAGMTKRNAESATKANDLARQARTAADAGAADMQAMSTAMNDIKVSSDDIAKIIKTIDEIAFQTNILALNAAVEAARAGEAGMGFAVVADEVRTLAQRAAQAAKETAGKIEAAITKTTQGVQISAKVSVSLNEIVEKIRQVDELVGEVTTASREQNQGVQQITTAVTQMDKVTQANAAGAEESAAAAEELTSQSVMLQGAVAELRRLVDGSAAAATSPTAPSTPRPAGVVTKKPRLARAAMPGPASAPPVLDFTPRRNTTPKIPSSGNGHADDHFKNL